MKLLAVNTAGARLEAGLIVGGSETMFRDDEGRHASTGLMPAVDRLLKDAGLTVGELDGFGVCVGPGSFTGIRIGLSAVRAMCYALDKPAIAVNLGQVLAYNIVTDAESVVSVWDAGNGYAYVAAYENGTGLELLSPRCLTIDETEKFLASIDEPFAVSTDSVMRRFGIEGGAYGLLQAVRRENGFKSYEQLVPLYVRLSQAEKDARAR